jgi:hypothetical protein
LFVSQAMNGIGYVRCALPARAIEAQVIELDRYLPGKTSIEECWSPFDGPAVFQLPANWARLHAMRDYRRITGQPVLVEADDDYIQWDRSYIRGQTTLEVISMPDPGWVEHDVPETSGERYLQSVVSSPEILKRACREADGVIVSTKHLATVFGKHAQRVFVCRNIADPDDWPEPQPRDDGVFRVVFSASPNWQDLKLVRKAMEWAAQQPGVEAWMVGFKAGFKGVKQQGWVQSVPEYRKIMSELRPDVWLRPIETTQFARGKSDLKVLEAAMVGALPIVSSYDPYMDWAGTPVRFAHNEKAWQQEVRWCVKNQDRVRADAAVVRELVLQDRGLLCAQVEWGHAINSTRIMQHVG